MPAAPRLPGARAAYLNWDVAAHRDRILRGELPPGRLWIRVAPALRLLAGLA